MINNFDVQGSAFNLLGSGAFHESGVLVELRLLRRRLTIVHEASVCSCSQEGADLRGDFNLALFEMAKEQLFLVGRLGPTGTCLGTCWIGIRAFPVWTDIQKARFREEFALPLHFDATHCGVQMLEVPLLDAIEVDWAVITGSENVKGWTSIIWLVLV